jgi:5-methylcytosine-specific restriction endonuclease McrA
MSTRTLLLTPWFFPVKILRWEDAVKMKYEQTIDVIVEYDEDVCSPSIRWKMPAVIRLKKMSTGNKKKGVKFSRVNVYQRDGFKCQYCGHKFSIQHLSYDHVVPRKAGGRTIWENIVTACKPCNSRKDCRSTDESGMFPLKWPKRPDSLPLMPPVVDLQKVPTEWVDYLQSYAY